VTEHGRCTRRGGHLRHWDRSLHLHARRRWQLRRRAVLLELRLRCRLHLLLLLLLLLENGLTLPCQGLLGRDA
jgi:hypothetical protein